MRQKFIDSEEQMTTKLEQVQKEIETEFSEKLTHNLKV